MAAPSKKIFLLGAATLSLSYIPLMSWVAVSPVILMDAGGLTTSEFAWSQVPVFSAVIIANLSVARWVKEPTIRMARPSICTGTALRTKRGRVGSFTQRATDRLAMITALKTGTWLQANSLVVSPPSVARWVKDPTRPRFVLSAVPVQMLGLAILIVGNLVWPHVWLWSVLGTCFYAFGIGLIFPTLFRFTLFSNDLPKGTFN